MFGCILIDRASGEEHIPQSQHPSILNPNIPQSQGAEYHLRRRVDRGFRALPGAARAASSAAAEDFRL